MKCCFSLFLWPFRHPFFLCGTFRSEVISFKDIIYFHDQYCDSNLFLLQVSGFISTSEALFCQKSFGKTKSNFPFSSLQPFSDFKNVQVYFRSDANRIHRHGSLFTVQSVATDWRRDFPTQWDPGEWKERWRRQLCSRSWKTSKTSGKTQLVLGCSLTIHNLCREQTRISSVSNLSKFILLWIQTLQKLYCQKLLQGYPYQLKTIAMTEPTVTVSDLGKYLVNIGRGFVG